MGVFLPDDILHLICLELSHLRDYNTLFQCAIAGKALAAPALANLYRMHNSAPVTTRGIDEIELSRSERYGNAAQEVIVQKWALLWRSILRSSLDKTLFTYCRYIRALDLRDLKYLLDEPRFRTFDKQFFADELAPFNIEIETPRKSGRPSRKVNASRRLNVLSIIDAIGEGKSPTPILEELSGEISGNALSRWASRLPRLRSLELYQGSALRNGAENMIHIHCPFFRKLSIYSWLGEDADQQMGDFLIGLRPDTLEYFEVISFSDLGVATFLALNHHKASLRELRLSNLKTEAIHALPALKSCTAIVALHLEELHGTTDLTDLGTSQNNILSEIVEWLRSCKQLETITVKKMRNGPAILTSVLLENSIHLRKIEVEGYTMRDNQDFHRALASQPDLQSVKLKGESENIVRDDLDILVGSLSNLTKLRDLQLREVSDYFRDEHICTLASNLTRLEELYISGFGITDIVWRDISRLSNLRTLSFNAMTGFTLTGILGYISSLGASNKGLVISIDNADPGSNLDEDEQRVVREAIASKVEGRFNFTLMRGDDHPNLHFQTRPLMQQPDPDQPDFEGDSD
ncbi:MAG: hypothetical protein M1812_003316 [Candelaria pacifica]|nr:MAG: hypothetical protein M1812_003316 [Candelaria pacifica]